MSIVTVEDLHTVPDPETRLSQAAALAHGSNGTDARRLIVRCPDRASNGVRVFRANDIAQMLQRHGRLREIAVTDAGTIVAAADVCRRRGEVAIWTGQAIGPWAPSDIVRRGLGGSETAAVRLAEELAAMGYVVSLYGHFDQDGMCGDVMLRHFGEFDPTSELDALIGFRDARLFDERPNARFRALWLEDLAPAEGLTPSRAANIDRVVAVSHWHRGQVLREHPWLDDQQIAAGRNGIVRRWFQEGDAPERESRVVYSSSPDRGGDVILECWPRVREQVPDAELVLTYSRWFDLCAQMFAHAQGQLKRIGELLEQPGVHRIEGGLGQMALAHLLRTSQVWAHPSYYTPGAAKFEETSCISAMEAQAAGCVVVASNWGALTETVQHGTLVDGDPRDPDGSWRHQFVQAIVRGLTDEPTQHQAQSIGPEMVRDMDWRGAAEQLAAMFPRGWRDGGPVPVGAPVGANL
jgi:glycosyltransferase involved in cell wall biosynthesis